MMTATNAPPAYVASPQPVGQQQIVMVQPTPVNVGYMNAPIGNWKGIQWTGIFQLVLGSLTVILGIVTTLTFSHVVNNIGSPIWCGFLFYVVAGILGIVSGCKKNAGMAIGYMVMSILSCLAACCVIGFGSRSIAYINSICYRRSYYGGYYTYYNYSCNLQASMNGVYATLLILAAAEFVVAIVGASMTCSPLCYRPTTQSVVHYQARPRMVVTSQPQGPAFYNIPPAQPQFAYPAQQGPYPQTQAPPIGDSQLYQEPTK